MKKPALAALLIAALLLAGCGEPVRDLVIESGKTTIRTAAYKGRTAIETVVIPDTVTEIGDEAFRDCTTLRSVIIPDSVVKIGERAFQNCGSLKEVVIPDSVREIGKYAFHNCGSLESVSLPHNIEPFDCFALTPFMQNTTKLVPDSFEGAEDWTEAPAKLLEDGERVIPLTAVSYVSEKEYQLLENIYRWLSVESRTADWREAKYALFRADSTEDMSKNYTGRAYARVAEVYLCGQDGTVALVYRKYSHPPLRGQGILYGDEITDEEIWEAIRDRF